MPTIIDSLVVLLGLDSKDLESKTPTAVKSLAGIEKQGEKTEKSVAKISKTSKDTAHNVESLTRVVTTFLSVIGGTMAIKAFISDFIETNAQIDRLSRNLGLSVSTISAWSNATEKLGGSAQGLQGTLDMLSKSQTQLMLTGESGLIPYMSALGVSLADVGGKARPVTDILLDLSDRFSKMDRTTANNMGRMMGIDQGTLNLLLQGRKELELEIKRQKEQNAVTKAQAEEASKLQRSIVGVKQTFSALARSLLMEAAPTIEKVLTILQNFANWAQDNREFIADFLKVIAVGLGAIALVTLPIDLTVAAVVALAAAIALLWQDYQTWKRGGDSLIDWGKWKPGIDGAIQAVTWLKDAIEALFNSYTKLWTKVTGGDFFKDFGAGMQAIGDFIGIRRGGASNPNGKPAATSAAAGGPIASQAQTLAQQVSKQTGIPADLIFAQWQHETGGFTNRGSKELNNLAGINVPGSKTGTDYRKFDSLQAFGDYYSNMMRPGGLYPDASKAQTAEQFAAALKSGGYYSAPESQYASGMNRWLNQDRSSYAHSLSGIPGAASVAAGAPQGVGASTNSVDRSVKAQFGDINIHTAATDAAGIARDIEPSLDFLFVSQANPGLN